jgi:predicted outer membrane lipoprotein
MWYVLGIISAFVFLIILAVWSDAREKKKKEREEFEEYKKQKKNQSPETVDAQFIEVTPKGLNPHSQALVRRNNNLIRRDV